MQDYDEIRHVSDTGDFAISADVETSHARSSFWIKSGMVIISIILLLIIPEWLLLSYKGAMTPSSASNNKQLKIGLYNAFSLSTYYASKAVRADVKIISQIPPDKNQFDLLVMSLTAVLNHSKELNGWHIVWVPDHAGVRLLLKNKTPIGQAGQIKAETDTSGVYLMDRYIQARCQAGDFKALAGMDCYSSQIRYRNDSSNASEFIQQADNVALMAAVEPFAEELEEQYHFTPVSDFSSDAADLNVLLVGPRLSQPGFELELGDFIDQLLTQNERAVNKAETDSVTLRKELKDMLANTNVSDEGLKDILNSYRSFSLQDNIQFLYDFGPNGCASLMQSISSQDASRNSCGLIEDGFVDNVLGRLEAIRPYSVRLNEDDLEKLCLSNRRVHLLDGNSIIAGFDPIGSASLTEEMRAQIQELKYKLNAGFFYCFIGHGDDEDTQKHNIDVGKKRADTVASWASKLCNFPSSKLVRVSLGKLDAYGKQGKRFRRVEIKKIDIVPSLGLFTIQ